MQMFQSICFEGWVLILYFMTKVWDEGNAGNTFLTSNFTKTVNIIWIFCCCIAGWYITSSDWSCHLQWDILSGPTYHWLQAWVHDVWHQARYGKIMFLLFLKLCSNACITLCIGCFFHCSRMIFLTKRQLCEILQAHVALHNATFEYRLDMFTEIFWFLRLSINNGRY